MTMPAAPDEPEPLVRSKTAAAAGFRSPVRPRQPLRHMTSRSVAVPTVVVVVVVDALHVVTARVVKDGLARGQRPARDRLRVTRLVMRLARVVVMARDMNPAEAAKRFPLG